MFADRLWLLAGLFRKLRRDRRRAEVRCNLDTKALRATQRATGAVGGYRRSSWVWGRARVRRRLCSATRARRATASAVAWRWLLPSPCRQKCQSRDCTISCDPPRSVVVNQAKHPDESFRQDGSTGVENTRDISTRPSVLLRFQVVRACLVVAWLRWIGVQYYSN